MALHCPPSEPSELFSLCKLVTATSGSFLAVTELRRQGLLEVREQHRERPEAALEHLRPRPLPTPGEDKLSLIKSNTSTPL